MNEIQAIRDFVYFELTSIVNLLWRNANLTNRKCQFPRTKKQTRVRLCSWTCLLLNNSSFSAPLKPFQYKSASNVYSPWSLCSVNHSNICSSSSGYFGVKRPIVVRFANIFSSPLKSLAWSLHQRRTIDSLSPYSRAISELFSTASASATTLSLKSMLHDEWRGFGKMNSERLIIDFGKQLFLTIKISLVAFL